jgi:hypothetical protein
MGSDGETNSISKIWGHQKKVCKKEKHTNMGKGRTKSIAVPNSIGLKRQMEVATSPSPT